MREIPTAFFPNSETEIPTVVVFFHVIVPVGKPDDLREEQERAEGVVANYLYGGAHVIGSDLAEDESVFRVLVRREFYGAERPEVERLLTVQRDRFASGMYAMKEPTYLVAAS